MEVTPRDYGERSQFDRYCKLVLQHEAIDYHREMKRRCDREISLSALSKADMDKLGEVDHYPSDSTVFSAYGCELRIDNELVAETFAKLPSTEQSILILHCVMDLPDGEIGALVGLSRSAVQRHRTKTLQELRTKLMALMPKGG
jgi:RNA polymerase sigma factor (sigma-70 family)